MSEVPCHTHITANSGKFSRIDRVRAMLPWSLLTVACARATVVVQPEWLSAAGLSDHAPVVVVAE